MGNLALLIAAALDWCISRGLLRHHRGKVGLVRLEWPVERIWLRLHREGNCIYLNSCREIRLGLGLSLLGISMFCKGYLDLS